MRGDAIDFVIGGHDGDGAGFAESFFEGVEKCLAQDALGDVGRGAVHAGFRLAVADEMLQRGENVLLVAEVASPWKPCTAAMPKARHEIGILAVGLFHAAPARLTRHVDHGSQRMVRAADASLEGGHGEELLDEAGIESGAQRDGLRKAGAVGRGVAVQAFLVKHDGDAEPRILEEEFLDRVGELGHLRGPLRAAARVAGPAHLAEAARCREKLSSLWPDRSCPSRRRASAPFPARRRASARPFLRGSCGERDL